MELSEIDFAVGQHLATIIVYENLVIVNLITDILPLISLHSTVSNQLLFTIFSISNQHFY